MLRFVTAAILPVLLVVSADAPRSAHAALASVPPAGPATTFVKLARMQVPIFGNSRVEGRIDMALVLQMPDAESAKAIQKDMPLVRDRLLAATLEFGSLYASGFTPVDAQRLSATLNATVRSLDVPIQRVLLVELKAAPV